MTRTKAVLIIGGSGFIGTHLALKLREGYKVFATYHSRSLVIPGVTLVPFNVGNRNWIKRVVYAAKPDVVIYVAGNNSVAAAEADARGAELVHTSGPATVSSVADIYQPKFIYLSNCYTFDGNRGNYHETDVVLPGNVIGKSKVGGENFIKGRSFNYVIVRSSPLFGRGNGYKTTFLDHLRMALDKEQRMELPTSELHSFAPINGLVELVGRLIEAGPRNKVLHYGGLTKLSYYDFARAFAKRFNYNPELILQTKQAREIVPTDFSLNCTQAVETLKIKPLLLEEGFDLFEQELVTRLG